MLTVFQVAYMTGLDNGACPPGYPIGFMHVCIFPALSSDSDVLMVT
jgi:hypothetical protein